MVFLVATVADDIDSISLHAIIWRTVRVTKKEKFRKKLQVVESSRMAPSAGMLARMTEAPLTRLKRRGVLNVWEQTAADDITAGYHAIAGQRMAHDPALGIASACPCPDGAERAAVGRLDAVAKYREWYADLRGTEALAAVTAILLNEQGIRATERAEGWRNGSATGYLLTGLRHFAAIRGNTPRGVKWRYAKNA